MSSRDPKHFSKPLPGEVSPYQLARDLYANGKSLLVISGLTGLPRKSIADLLKLGRPVEVSKAYKPRERTMWEDTITPVMYGSKLDYAGPILKRHYRVIHNAKLSPLPTGGEKMESGKVALKTSDFSEAIHACKGKKSVVVDSRGLVLAKGAVHSYR